MQLKVIYNTARGVDSKIAKILANGLELRAKDISKGLLVQSRVDKIRNKKNGKSVTVSFKNPESFECWTAQGFANHMGIWLNEIMDGSFSDTGLLITVEFGKEKGSWRRK